MRSHAERGNEGGRLKAELQQAVSEAPLSGYNIKSRRILIFTASSPLEDLGQNLEPRPIIPWAARPESAEP